MLVKKGGDVMVYSICLHDVPINSCNHTKNTLKHFHTAIVHAVGYHDDSGPK